MRRTLVTVLMAVAVLIGASGCSAQTVQIWWNANGGASNPLSTAQAQVFADKINETCHPSYWKCLPYSSDYDCAGGSGNGPSYTGVVFVIGQDSYGLDADGDGVGCEP